MNSTQNRKIEQVTAKTLVIGIDVGSEEHYAREIGKAILFMAEQARDL